MVPRITTTIVAFLIAASTSALANSTAPAVLSVKLNEPIQYRNARGERVEARYGNLSDDSLHFVKLRLPDGRQYTLPRTASGSGVRFTDERELVWWEHQGKVRIEVRNANGEWTIKYDGLVPVGKPR